MPEFSAEKPCRILSLDGGGAKGFYILGVLREIEGMIKCTLGTSTGAIIAALVGLGKSVKEISTPYEEHVPTVMRKANRREKSAVLRLHRWDDGCLLHRVLRAHSRKSWPFNSEATSGALQASGAELASSAHSEHRVGANGIGHEPVEHRAAFSAKLSRVRGVPGSDTILRNTGGPEIPCPPLHAVRLNFLYCLPIGRHQRRHAGGRILSGLLFLEFDEISDRAQAGSAKIPAQLGLAHLGHVVDSIRFAAALALITAAAPTRGQTTLLFHTRDRPWPRTPPSPRD
jgi:patatin-like phospholipase